MADNELTRFVSDEYRVVEGLEGKGMGLFALRAYAPGDPIYPMDYWSRDLMPMHATNHSCEPNGDFVDGVLVAVRAIAPGDEITFDYIENPTPASKWNFACACGAPTCRGWVETADGGR